MPWVSSTREPLQNAQAGNQEALSGREPSESVLAVNKVPGGHATHAGDVYQQGGANTLNEFGEVVSFVRVVKGELPRAEEKEPVQLRTERTLNAKPHEVSFSESVEKEESSAESYHGQVPDRSSTASAPPDFEMTSRALFGFMEGYSTAFTDGRQQQNISDPNYNALKEVNDPDDLSAQSRGLSAKFSQLAVADQPRLRREDSDASVEDLINRARMPPLHSSGLARDDSELSLSSLAHVPDSSGSDLFVRDRAQIAADGDVVKANIRGISTLPPAPSMLNSEMWKQQPQSALDGTSARNDGSGAKLPAQNAGNYFENPAEHAMPSYGSQFAPFQPIHTPWMPNGMSFGRGQVETFRPAFPAAVLPYTSSKATPSAYEANGLIPGYNGIPVEPNPSLRAEHPNFGRSVQRSSPKAPEQTVFDNHRGRGPLYNSNHAGSMPRPQKVAGLNSTSASSTLKLNHFSEAVGRVKELARDQHGCRYLQTKLEEGNKQYTSIIFEECFDEFVDLMVDPFGNYLCQKLFEHCDDSQRLMLIEFCAHSLARVSANMHGTRAVQRMVECFSTEEQITTACSALAPSAVLLMKDINGNHVIQRCLHRMDSKHNQFVYDAVAGNCLDLATHRHGCCVMQRCIDHASPAQRDQLVSQVTSNALLLVQNPYGNYVVQYVLELGDIGYTMEIIKRLQGHVGELSTQKFSSNVVEKCLQQGNAETRSILIEELISDSDMIGRLLHDAYGNYVIQRSLQLARSPQLEALCEAIRPHLPSLKSSPYGKRIQSKILKRFPKNRDREEFSM
ncbi:hypothetical protein NDN08_000490 [Rhodosorus marinus]|uniref:PUM-HD domain-containing protein n=1 Tax=Rhodosorus marinus TaxID=101924 RepID=A0AAV8UNA8_9RHOD|nr:hypothetical protein NDN08_000490 [Rhodosorus marinus]